MTATSDMAGIHSAADAMMEAQSVDARESATSPALPRMAKVIGAKTRRANRVLSQKASFRPRLAIASKAISLSGLRGMFLKQDRLIAVIVDTRVHHLSGS